MALDDEELTDASWPGYRRLVLAELKRLNDHMDRQDRVMEKLQTEIVMLKVKSGLWGAVAAAVTVLAALMMQWLKQ